MSHGGNQAATLALVTDLYLSYIVGLMRVAVGQWVSIRCCNMSEPGSVMDPSDLSKVPILIEGRASNIFLKALMPCVESIFSL